MANSTTSGGIESKVPGRMPDSKEPLKIQVAFQGGGAKLVPLLAVVKGLQEAEKEGLIKVTRVAGTSAGAIAACMLATLHDVDKVRQHLKDRGAGYLKQLGPTWLSKWNPVLGWRVISGRPMIPEARIKNVFASLFAIFGDDTFIYLRQLKLPVKIMAADVVGQSIYHFDRDVEQDGNMPISTALWHSCGLPFVFKSVHNLSDPAYVDGGICENLPSDLLRDGDFGKIVAVTFQETDINTSVSNVFGLCASLLNTAIRNSVYRATISVGKEQIIEVETRLSTFDFKKALSPEFLEENFGRVVAATKKRIHEMLPALSEDSALKVDPSKETIGVSTFQRELYDVYVSQHENTSYRFIRTALIAQANCLCSADEEDFGEADWVTQIYEFEPTDVPMYCFKLNLETSGQFDRQGVLEGDARWRCFAPNGKKWKTVVLPVTGGDNTAGLVCTHVLVFFTPPLPPRSGIYTLMQDDSVMDSMVGLREDRAVDGMSLSGTRNAPCERCDLILLYPQSFQALKMRARDVTGKIEGKSLAGRPMTDQELFPVKKNGRVPAGFDAIGWTAVNGVHLVKGDFLGVELYRER
jgi:predicted acylesterase/phospholipase RssA